MSRMRLWRWSGLIIVALLTLPPATQANAAMDTDLSEMGLLDVTAPPFSADPTRQTDSTAALQAAIDHARDHCMVTWFSPGEYLVSDTVKCVQGRGGRKARVQDAELLAMGFGIGPRALPCVLMGSTRGDRRPRIVLADDAPGFGDPGKPKYVVHFVRLSYSGKAAPQASFNQMFVGIDITIGEGNPGAVGIRHRAAQGSAVQDCTIDATHGLTGLEGGAGSGGGHANVTIIGGRIGADLLQAQPAPTITGFTLVGQTDVALRYAGYETLTAVGLRIESDTSGPAVMTRAYEMGRDLFGQLSLVDSIIDMAGPGSNLGILTETSLYIGNVYVRGMATIARHATGDELTTSPEGWTRVVEYARGIDPPNKRLVYQYLAPAYVDGQRLPDSTLPAVLEDAAPPDDLQRRHLWDETFPTWETPGAVNVKSAPYGATGDGETNDTSAIQQAIDSSDVVFLPRGKYLVSRTLRLRPATRLIGVGRVFTRIYATEAEGGDFNDNANPSPVIETPDDADASTIVGFLGVSASTPGAYAIRWQSGRRSIYRAVENWVYRARDPEPATPLLNHPQVLVCGNGGGKWYNFHADHFGTPRPNYRHLMVRETREPLRLYQCNPEHSGGDANMEIAGAENVWIYGLKGESPTPILIVRDSSNVHLLGYGGNAIPPAGESLVVMDSCDDYLIANLVDRPMGVRGDPTSWHALIERTPSGETIALPPLARPVVYKRGQPLNLDRP